MSALTYHPMFLPMTWEGSQCGLSALSWRDDPLGTQSILSAADYSRCFPENNLPWPLLGEILLPEGTPETVKWDVSTQTQGETLTLTSCVRNAGDTPVTLNYVRLALPMDQCFRGNDVFKYEQNVIRHAGLIGQSTYLYWQKPGGRPPLYLMVAQGDTEVSRFFVDERYGTEAWHASFEGLYALEMEDFPLLLHPGEEKRYVFRLGIVETEAQLHGALVALGGLAADVLPGAAVPRGEKLRIHIESVREVDSVYFADGCAPVCDCGNGWYESTGAGAGEKRLIIRYADGGFSRLKLFIIDPVADIIRDHARHIAENQLETDPADPCYHGILAWNMTDRCRVNHAHNPFDNWMAGGSDEIGLVSGLFLSEKNVYWPSEEEIRVLGLHVQDFIEDRLTEQPGNRVHRMVPWFVMFEPWAGYGADDVWRAFNYVHVANICYNMYRIASAANYPSLKPAKHYLRRAYDYTVAMFNYWMFPEGVGATKYANMGEMNLPLKFIPALRQEGMAEQADHLEKLMLEKAQYFSTRDYPFGSEMAFDTTAYEAVYAYAKLIGDQRIIQRAISATLANRARIPIWHKHGIDVRQQGDSGWNVSYMTQLGAWPLVDSLLEGTLTDPDAALIAHASTLGGFTMYNSGGYWDDAPINRHASWWVMNDRLNQGNRPVVPQRKMSGEVGLGYFGALYSTCAMLVMHPRLGQLALGCQTEETVQGTVILPRPCFGLRLCDLAHGYALVCDGCEIDRVTLCDKALLVQVKPLPGRKSEMTLRVRQGNAGKWESHRAPWAETHEFVCHTAGNGNILI